MTFKLIGTYQFFGTGTGRREHVDVFLCAPIKSLIFFSFVLCYVFK